MAYRAEIEIGVKGARQLKQLQEQIKDLAFRADALQAITDNLFPNTAVQSVRNYANALNEAKAALSAVEMVTDDETEAIKAYVTALGESNAAAKRQNDLIQQEITLRNKAKKSVETRQRREEFLAGPGRTLPAEKAAQRSFREAERRQARFAAEAQFAKDIFNVEKNFDKVLRDTEIDNLLRRYQLEENLQKRAFNQLIAAGKAEGENFDKRLAQKTTDRINANKKVNSDRVKKAAALYRLEQRNNKRLETERLAAEAKIAARRRDALGSAIIGGAFPLLFGQGAGAAVLGGAGGAAGGLMGGQFGFGLSLVGTALGTAVDTFVANVGELARSLGDPISAIQAFENAGFELDKTLKLNVEKLLEAGDAYEAQRLVIEEVNRTMGPDAVGQMVAYDLEMKELNASYRELTARLQAALLPVLVGTIDLINDLVSTFKILADSPLFGLLLKQARVMPGIGPAIGAFGTLGGRGRGLGRQQSGQFIPLDPSVRAAAEKVRQQRELKFQRELQRIEKDRIASQRKAQKDRRKVLQDLLDLEQKINDVSLERIKEENRRLERQKNSRKELLRTQIKLFDVQAPLADELLGPQEAIEYKLERLKETKVLQDELFRIERLAAEVEAQRNNPATLKNVVETYKLLAYIRESEYQSARRTLEADQARLQVYGAMASLSAAAGFQVSGELPGAFVPKGAAGILGPGTGLTDFMTGAELAPIIEQEVALARVLEKYQEIGQAAQLTSELVTTGFIDMVSGTRSAEQVFADFLNSLADMLIKTAQQMIAQYIAIGIARMFAMGQSASSVATGIGFNPVASYTGSGPISFAGFPIDGKANGGPVSGGTPYVVGERGPELFVPRSSGTVVPNDKMGGGVTVGSINISVENSGDSLSPAAQKQIAGQVQGIVLSTLANERRSGGML